MGSSRIDPAWLATTWFIDHDHPMVARFVDEAVGDAVDPVDVTVRLLHSVRDGIRYDPYNTDYRPEAFRASSVAASATNWCVPKSVLLTAAARRCGIPAHGMDTARRCWATDGSS